MKLLIMTQFSPVSCPFHPLRSHYLPQHSILQNPQPMFFPSCERPSFTPVQNNLFSLRLALVLGTN